MVPRLNPLLRMILTHPNFGMGPKRSAAGDGAVDCQIPQWGTEWAGFPIVLGEHCHVEGQFARGVIDTMNIVHDVSVISYRPRTIQDDLLLASTGGYIADFQRAQLDALALVDAAAWRWDFLKSASDTLAMSDISSGLMDISRQIEQAMVLNSTVVNNTTYLRTISQILALSDQGRQSQIMESILDIMLLDHQANLTEMFVREVAQNLGLTSASQGDVIFIRALSTVLNASQTAAVTSDFVRAVEDILLLVDEADRFNALIQAAASTLALSPSVLHQWDFSRPGTHDVGVTDSADDGYVAICDQLVYSDIGWDYVNDPMFGRETASFAMELGSHSSSNVNYWVKYQQCWETNLQVSEPPTPNYGGTGVSGLVGAGKWRGGVLSQAGYLYFVPYSNTYTYKFDPSTNTGANLTTSHTGTNKWAGGCLSAGGNIICAPDSATQVLHINTSNDAETKFGSFTGNDKWCGAYLNKNNWAICAQRTSSQILAVNPESTANDVYLSNGPTTPSLAGGQIGPDGVSLYVAPASSTRVLKCNTSNHQNITWAWLSGGPYGGSNEYYGLVLEPSGNIYGIPFNATSVLKIETNNNDYESTFGTLTGNAKWTGGCLCHDLRIYTAFWNATNALVIRTGNDTTFTFNTWTTNQMTVGINALPDARMIPICANLPAIPRYYGDATSNREPDFVLSPYWNKL